MPNPVHRPFADTNDPTQLVWIDQDLCTGDGLCVQVVPEVFVFDTDGLAYIRDQRGPCRAPGAMITVPTGLEPAVARAAAECPGACIHLGHGTGTSGDVEVRTPVSR